MKLPTFRRLFKTDYEQQFQALVDKLAVSLNIGIETLYDALNNKLTFKDNMACTVTQFIVTVDSNGTPVSPITLPLRFSLAIEGVFVLSATNQSGAATPPPGAVFVSYTSGSGNIIINKVTGLTPGTPYAVKIVVLN